MSWIDATRHRLRALFRPGAADRERDEEFAFHQSLAADDQLEATGDAADARSAARWMFGNSTAIKEEIRWMSATRWIDQLSQDLRFASRTLRKSPGFSIVAILSLAVGIAATTTIFTFVNAVFLRPLSYPNPD